MPSLYNLVSGAVAQAQDVQQIIDMLKGSAGLGIPASLTSINDSVNFALAVKNTETTNSRALQVLRANNLVMIQADANGVVVSPDGVAAAAQVVNLSLAQTLTNKTLTSPIITGSLSAPNADITGRRLKAAGTGLVNSDFALSAGWGSTATITANNGTDGRATFTVFPSGAGIAANPTITLTFKDGTWTSAPYVLCQLVGGTGVTATALQTSVTPTATTVQFQMFFTPTTGLTYQFTFEAIG